MLRFIFKHAISGILVAFVLFYQTDSVHKKNEREKKMCTMILVAIVLSHTMNKYLRMK